MLSVAVLQDRTDRVEKGPNQTCVDLVVQVGEERREERSQASEQIRSHLRGNGLIGGVNKGRILLHEKTS